MYYELTRQMRKQLLQIDGWLDNAKAFAEERKFDANHFLEARLAPDQFPFVRQVQMSCDAAKFATARLTGKDAPSHPDTEKTFDELRARIASTVAFLDSVTAKDFDGAATRTITQPRWEGKTMSGADYFLEHSVPNFFFHMTTAYALLRKNGVKIGKRDFLGPLTMRAPG